MFALWTDIHANAGRLLNDPALLFVGSRQSADMEGSWMLTQLFSDSRVSSRTA